MTIQNNKAKPVKPSSRLPWLDWTRGLATVIMLQGHCFHSFTRPDLREGAPYILSQFVGGMPPALFLFLTGVTLAFLMDSSERKNLAPWQRISAVLRRAGYLFALAFAFRIQMWIFALPANPITDIFKVDILNCMGLAIALMATLSVFSTFDRIRLSAGLGLAIAAAAPLVSALDWSAAPSLLKGYLAPDPNGFPLFPWGAFLAFGLSFGSILRTAPRERTERLMEWTALAGFTLVVGGRYFANLPYSLYPGSQFWLDSPALTFIKLGVILLMLAFAWLWTSYVVRDSWSWVRQLGTTSLIVYWVHTELVYGRWFWFWKEGLSVPATVVSAVVVIALMVGLSVLRTRWSDVRAWLSTRYRGPAASTASGD
jgi:uncharacterized membrane protein